MLRGSRRTLRSTILTSLALSTLLSVASSSAQAMGKFPWDAWEQEQVIIQRCPPLKQYGKDTLQKAAKELRALPPGSATPGMVRDYGVLRKQCEEAKPGVPR
jgi:hypothetical protein